MNSDELPINRCDDATYELNKAKMRNDKLETLLLESQEKLNVYMASHEGNELQGKVGRMSEVRQVVSPLIFFVFIYRS